METRSYTMTTELKEKMIRMLEEDKTDEEIINALGISRRCFYNLLDCEKKTFACYMSDEK